MSGDPFTRQKFEWLDLIAQEGRVSAGAFRLAYIIASRFLNRNARYAYPPLDTLARVLHLDERQVRRLAKELVAGGYLVMKRGGQGSANRYSMASDLPGKTDQLDWTDLSGQRQDINVRSSAPDTSFDRTFSCKRTYQKCPPNPLKPSEEDISVKKASKKDAAKAFETFWNVYPRKKAKGAAKRAFEKALKTASAQTIVDGAKRYAIERRGKDAEFTKHPATWLNGECWADDAPTKANGPAVPWDHAKYKAVIPLVKQRREWSPAYPPPSTIPRDLLDEELREILATQGRAALLRARGDNGDNT